MIRSEDAERHEALTRRAWQLIEQAVTTGRIALEGVPTPIVLDTSTVMRTAQWLAARTPKTPRSVPLPADLLVQMTQSGGPSPDPGEA
jgi:hypothetical protein